MTKEETEKYTDYISSDDGYGSDTETTPLIEPTAKESQDRQINKTQNHFAKQEGIESEIKKKKYKDVIIRVIGYVTHPLRLAIRQIDRFKKFLEDGYDITNQDAYGNNVLHTLHSAINKNDIDEFKKLLKDGYDITNQDAEGNSIVHLIAQQEKQKKNKYLDVVLSHAINAQTNDDLKKALNAENQNSLTPLQIVFTAKIEKEKHNKKIPNGKDNTVIFIKKLIENRADTDQLKLPEKVLGTLSETQKEYYHKFLNELGRELIKFQPKKKDVIIRVIECITHPLHSAIREKDIDEFKKLLKDGYDITHQDTEVNNIFHCIAKKLKGEEKLDFLNSVIEAGVSNAKLSEAINAQDSDGLTPLQVALTAKIEKEKHNKKIPNEQDNTLHFIKKLIENGADPNQLKLPEKVLGTLSETQKEYYHKFLNELGSELIKFQPEKKDVIIKVIDSIAHPLHSAIREKDIDEFKKRLKDGYDITNQDAEGSNVLHLIAGEKKKVEYLNAILSLVERKEISAATFTQAVNVTNEKGETPLKLALIKKAKKEPCKHLSKLEAAGGLTKNYSDTTKFCALLLEKGANYDQLYLNDEELHTEKYYLTLCNLKECSQVSPEVRKEANRIKMKFEEKYNVQTFSKYAQRKSSTMGSSMKEAVLTTGKALSSVVKYIDPAKRTRELLATTIATAVVAMTVFAFFQGQITIGAALPVIAITGAICLVLTFGFDAIKNFVTKPNEEQTSQVSSKMDGILIDYHLQNNKAVITPIMD